MSNEVPAVSAAVRILERMAAELPKAVTPTVLVNDLELNRSTCYNILATLQRAGWVSKLDGRGGWTLGPRLLALTGVSDDAIVTVVQDEIDVLSRRLGYVVFAAKQDDSGGYTVIAVSDPRRGVRVIVDVGDRFPFSAPALMEAMYAYRPAGDFVAATRGRTVEKFTEHTVTDRESLADVFALVRHRGFSTSVRQFNLAQSAVAAPVFDGMARPSLVIGTLAFSSELDYGTIDPIGKLINSAAARITERTGGVLPADASSASSGSSQHASAS